jgi:hypothetical protein
MPVPRMGVHWVNREADELNGKVFTQTFIRGSCNGQMIFYEPMVTKAFLDSKPSLSRPIAPASCYAPAGYHLRRIMFATIQASTGIVFP